MYNPFSPRQQTERSFIPDDNGTPLFHPWGTIGRAYRMADSAQQETVTRTFTRWLRAFMLIAGLGLVWASYADSRNSLLALLAAMALLILLMNLHLGRMTRGCDRPPNRAFSKGRIADWRVWVSGIAIGVYMLVSLQLGHWLRHLL